jgi:H+/Cl- antiporter ClcA
MKNASFYINWWSLVLGFFLGIVGVLFTLFAKIDRKDKLYSSLLGCAIGMAVNFILFKNGYYNDLLRH